MRGSSRLIGALTGLLALPVAAQDAPAPCLSGEAGFAPLLAALEAEGWEAVPPGAPIPEEAVARIALAQVAFYVGGDQGGASVPALLELQRRTVPGFARKVDTETARARILTRDGAAMMLSWSAPAEGIAQVTCRIATSEGEPAQGTEAGFGAPIVSTRDAPPGRVAVTPLEPARLEALTGVPAPATTVIETFALLSAPQAPEADQ